MQKLDFQLASVVGHYNIDNRDNKDNILPEGPVASSNTDNNGDSFSSGEASPNSRASLNSRSGDPICSGVGIAPDENLTRDQISRALIQFFDNGEDAVQRYKLKIRFNLTDKTNPEFIANLTKDWSNFTKYIPAECKDEIKEIASNFRAEIKRQYNIMPYMGKFHLVQKHVRGIKKYSTNIEPYTIAFVWYDASVSSWRYFIKFYGFIYKGMLNENYITAEQKKVGVKSQDLFINEKYNQVQRPKTWAQQRLEAKNNQGDAK